MGQRCPTGLHILLPAYAGPAALFIKLFESRLFSLQVQKYLPFIKTTNTNITLE